MEKNRPDSDRVDGTDW